MNDTNYALDEIKISLKVLPWVVVDKVDEVIYITLRKKKLFDSSSLVVMAYGICSLGLDCKIGVAILKAPNRNY